ncbi:PepSY-associated TM helix domain-containing protein [Pantoea sp. FN060301]|uniref:PepSY-associated TM helix domain-containing protein n=1 Tax=Pantoea sp. FN060301 TaxID=3420380 RepID=UPI003D1836E3
MEKIMSENTLAHSARAEQSRSALLQLLRRLHFYIGLFIGPFIFMAALTGTLYVLSPQLENTLYSHQLFAPVSEPAKPLSQQIHVAQQAMGADVRLAAVRPAPSPGETTRVMFSTPTSGPSETTAVFIDPSTLDVRGILDVYGTSGVLPFRTWLDYLHRNLLLGDAGRNYSELAASWLWVAALGGGVLWAAGRRTRRASQKTTSRSKRTQRRHWHSSLGLLLLLGLLFFSATGLTWSRWAGDNISLMRAHFGWMTPSVNTALPVPVAGLHQTSAGMSHSTGGMHAMPQDEHAGHQMADMKMAADEHAEHKMAGMAMPADPSLVAAVKPAQFDGVLAAARMAGIDAGKIEIRPASVINKAWTVSEIDRSWPTQVDSVAVDPRTFHVVDKVEFAQFGLLAKLTRWGVDAHMGVLFGLPNQLILAFFGLGLCTLIVMGYRLWWQRRPLAGEGPHPAKTLLHHWRQLSLSVRFLLLICTLALAVSLPVMGLSLLLLLIVDALRWQRAVRAQAA